MFFYKFYFSDVLFVNSDFIAEDFIYCVALFFMFYMFA